MSTNQIRIYPQSGSITDAKAYFGIGRSKLYELNDHHPGLFRKLGAKNIVDFNMLSDIVAALPISKRAAPIKPAKRRRPHHEG
jgi:hypothetical protein